MFPHRTAAIRSAPSLAAYSETSLLNNFKSQHQLWPIHTVTHSLPLALPQSFHPSLPLSFLWSHFTVEPSEAYPNLSIGRGPIAVQGPRELSCELSTFLWVPFLLSLAGSLFIQTRVLPLLEWFWMMASLCSTRSYAQFTEHLQIYWGYSLELNNNINSQVLSRKASTPVEQLGKDSLSQEIVIQHALIK